MKSTLVFLAAAGMTVLGVARAEAANLMPLSAGVEARFGSQSYAYIAGDPFEMNISVPEPTSLALIPAAGLLLLLRRRMARPMALPPALSS